MGDFFNVEVELDKKQLTESDDNPEDDNVTVIHSDKIWKSKKLTFNTQKPI